MPSVVLIGPIGKVLGAVSDHRVSGGRPQRQPARNSLDLMYFLGRLPAL